MSLVERVRTLPALRPFLDDSHKWVVGVSGGPDSLALLHVLQQLLDPGRLIVAHLHHGLRPDADTEMEFVRQTAVSRGLPCVVNQVAVTVVARRDGLSLEAAGRQTRYRFLARVAGEAGATVVAVGHQADDQAETVLMHLLRGAGLDGLRGMAMVSALPHAEAVTLIRPFLTTARAEIEAYCQQEGLTPMVDASNRDRRFFRNRVRHELLPLLAEYNPQIDEQLRRLAELAGADVAWLAEQTAQSWRKLVEARGDGWLRFDRQEWLTLPLSLQRRTLRLAVREMAPRWREVGFSTIEQARAVIVAGQTGAQSVLPGALTVDVGYELVTITAESAAVPIQLPQLSTAEPQPLRVPGRAALNRDWVLAATTPTSWSLSAITQNRDPWLAFVDGAAVGQLVVRPRRPGERMQPLGMNGRRAKIKDVMVNRKIPARLRARWPLVAAADHPVWLVGHHLDERVRVTPATQQVVQLHCYRERVETSLPDTS